MPGIQTVPPTLMPQVGAFQPFPMAGGQQMTLIPGALPGAVPGLIPPPFQAAGTVPSIPQIPQAVAGSFPGLPTVPPQTIIGGFYNIFCFS